MTAFYNENDPKAAAWLRELIRQGHIAQGVVDERSIEDIAPYELEQFTQCHFFAGIGVWSYALRQAGWPDDRPVWTGSCPCQPFSAAGKGGGFADERHLWPAWHHLISQCRPRAVFGEQVASKDGLAWLDLVQADMEAAGYAFGALDLCAAGVGAPHIRQRLYFVANTDHTRPQGRPLLPQRASQRAAGQNGVADELADTSDLGRDGRRAGEAGVEPGEEQRPARLCATGKLANAKGVRRAGRQDDELGRRGQLTPGQGSEVGRVADSSSEPRERNSRRLSAAQASSAGAGSENGRHYQRHSDGRDAGRLGPVNGFWQAADWIGCTDDKWRAVEPGTFPLAHGAAARVGRLRGYGNAIVAPLATAFIEAFLDTQDAT